MFEECPLIANDEDKLVFAMRLHFAQVCNQLNRFAPTQVARQFAIDKTLVKQIEVMPDMFTHLISMAVPQAASCIPLLTPSSAPSAFHANVGFDRRLGDWSEQ